MRKQSWEEQVHGQPLMFARHSSTSGGSQVRLPFSCVASQSFNLPLHRHHRKPVWWSSPRVSSPQVSANQTVQSGVHLPVYKLRGTSLYDKTGFREPPTHPHEAPSTTINTLTSFGIVLIPLLRSPTVSSPPAPYPPTLRPHAYLPLFLPRSSALV